MSAKRQITVTDLGMLATLALEVAVATPERLNSRPGAKAYVPAALVVRIRAQLEAADIDWRALVRERAAARKARRIERAEEARLSQAARDFVESTGETKGTPS